MTLPLEAVSPEFRPADSSPGWPQGSVEQAIDGLATEHANQWNRTPVTLVPFGRTFSRREQRENERTIERQWSESFDGEAGRGWDFRIHRPQLVTTIRSIVLMVDEQHREGIEALLNECFRLSEEFTRRARAMDPDLRPDEIYQAMRNLWIVNSMQWAFDLPLRLTPSAVAYSLLYPYTDNYLDNRHVTRADKRKFGQDLATRLAGFEAADTTPLFSRISHLVTLIEGEYPRVLYPEVYASLLAIHRAQEASLAQKAHLGTLPESGLLSISVMKGGTSVLADAFLTKGTISLEEMQFSFAYGIVLQFIDDLQDIDDDETEGSATLFTLAAAQDNLETMVNKLFRFTALTLRGTGLQGRARAGGLSQLIERSCCGLLLESVARHRERFRKAYTQALEQHSPLGFEFLRSLHDRRRSLEKRWNSHSAFAGPRAPTAEYIL
jgi:hypothetical protein